jgi:hypothetical protein
MSRQDPAAAMNGVGTGHICDSCNRRINHGDEAAMYVTWYDCGGWTPRRTWCLECAPLEINTSTTDSDEAILVGVFFSSRLVGVRVRDRCRPEEPR